MADNISSIKFYQGNTKSVGVNYFDYEGAVESGVERTKTIINIFRGKGYNVKRIGLCGGVDELSHTGYVSYSAAYTDAETFVNNAYSDYVVAKEKAEKEYGVWLSSYNFTDFSILFSNDDTSVRVFIGAGKDITIRTEDGYNIGLDEFVPLIKKEIYQDDCIVEGATDLDTASLDASTIVENISKKQLYYVTIENTKHPLLMNREIILIYDDKTKAETSTKKLSEKYFYTSIKATPIEDNMIFFSKMVAIGLDKFLLNGDGKILNASDFGCNELIKITDNISNLYDEIEDTQPAPKNITTSYSGQKKSSAKGIIIFVIVMILFVSFMEMIDDDSSSKKKSKSSSNKYRTEESYDAYKELQELERKRKAIEESQRIQDIIDSYSATSPSSYSPDYDISKIIGDYKKTVKNYTSDITYRKGTITNGIYKSEYIKLYGELEEGYSWMNSNDLSSVLPSDTYQLDWECGVKGKTSDYKIKGIFTLVIGEETDFEKCLDVLKKISPNYMLERSTGTGWFPDIQLAPGESDIDMNVLNQFRAYNHAVFNSDSGIKREYYFNKVNDRLVCLISQYDSNSSDEKIVEFVEKQ